MRLPTAFHREFTDNLIDIIENLPTSDLDIKLHLLTTVNLERLRDLSSESNTPFVKNLYVL